MHFRYSTTRHVGTIAALTAALVLLAACGNKDKSATQVAAKVDGEEISVHQINSVLARSGGITPENLPKAKREVLERLIEQQIAINEAVSRKLDRSPEVVTAIENAKREIIARSALDQIASNQPKPTDEEVKQYYSEHPELFAQRRLFNLQEIALRKNTPNVPDITAKVATAKTLEEVSVWLKEKNIEFTASGTTRSADQIPPEILPKPHQFKDGQMGLIEGNDAIFILRVVASRSAPLEEALALPRIRTFLFNQRGSEIIKREKIALKEKAKVEYLGEFSGGEAAFKAKVTSDAKASAEAAAQASAKAQADADALAKLKADEKAALQAESEAQAKARAQARAQAGNDQKPADPSSANVNLEKGIKGLK